MLCTQVLSVLEKNPSELGVVRAAGFAKYRGALDLSSYLRKACAACSRSFRPRRKAVHALDVSGRFGCATAASQGSYEAQSERKKLSPLMLSQGLMVVEAPV